MNKPDQNEELAWLAFQYVAGDLSVAATEEFELRLATDQGAREAVAEAVALFHTVCAAETLQPAMATKPAWSSAIVWRAVIALAAAVLLVVTLNLNSATNRSQDAALANAWSAVRADFASDEQPTPSVSTSAALTEADLALAEDDLVMSTEAPSWMTAAVLSLAGKQTLDSQEAVSQEN
ncbi:hypothetical protein [Anatilimnocola floriformis]|uniref:hypothetical protein n=1 Tax=Anatilimnocola floriformis TaxID=2948575 RepID=UPI0020C4D1E5|nr:hypothetical protein [Anatilimnocola floriformis]